MKKLFEEHLATCLLAGGAMLCVLMAGLVGATGQPDLAKHFLGTAGACALLSFLTYVQ